MIITLVRPSTESSLGGPNLEGLDLAITSAHDSSVTEWAANPYTRRLTRCVKRKSQEVAVLKREREIQGNIVWSLYGKITHLNKRDEDAQRVLMTKTEEINQFQEENKNLKAIIEALVAAKTKVAVHSSEEDNEVSAPDVPETPLSGVEVGAAEEPETPLSGLKSPHEEVTRLMKKDEEAQKVLMNKTDEIQQLKENNKSLEARIEALMAAKTKVGIPSTDDDDAPRGTEDRALEERDRALEERDRALGGRNRALEERNRALEELDRTSRERDRASRELGRTLEEHLRALGELDTLQRGAEGVSPELRSNPTNSPVAVPDNTPDLLRPWLYGMIDRGEVPGVEWLDADKKKFKIPWEHTGKREYDLDSFKLFKEWSIHTGKFRPEIDEPEPAVWKTRLRVALSDHPKIHEVKTESQPKDPINPYKVYVFSDKPQDSLQRILQDLLSQPGRGDGDQTMQELLQGMQELLQGMQAAPGLCPSGEFTIQEVALPMDVTTAAENPAVITEPLYTNAPIKIETRQLANVDMTQLGVGAEVTCDEDMETDDVTLATLPVATAAPTAVVAPELRIYPAHELDIEVVYYKSGKVFQHHVTNRKGCRLWFGDRNQPNLRQTVDPNLSPYLYGPADAEQILLPPHKPSNRQKDNEVVQILLDNMERGLVLTTENGNISATRLCKTKVFWKSNDNRNKQAAERLEREQLVPVFDYQNYLRELSAYGNSGGPKPKCEVIFSFGRSWSDEIPLENTPIYVIVRSRTAHNLMMAVDKGEELGFGRQNPVSSIDDMMSDDNEFDKLDVDVREYVKVRDF
ncbi:interferon regulatory factor 5-like [Branchiostoma floridae x Branchiostoma japonicum]